MINVLLLCDDRWHPAEVIELGIEPLKSHYNFMIVKNAKDILTPNMLSNYQVIMNCKGNQISAANNDPWFEPNVTEVTPKEFEAFVRQGGGFLSVHSGNTSKKVDDDYTKFIGNYFVGHPPRCEVDVKMTGNHPITREIEDFCIRDEHYNITLTAEDADIICKTYSETGGEQVGGYTRSMGAGRLCVLTPGHILEVWQHPMFQGLLRNAIHWCAGEN